MEKSLLEKLLTFDIKTIYSFLFDVAFYVSGFLGLFAVWMIFFSPIISLLFILFAIFVQMAQRLERVRIFLFKFLAFGGSLSILFLFLDANFKIFNVFERFNLMNWLDLEILVNYFVITILIVIIFFSIYFYFLIIFLKRFIFKETEDKKDLSSWKINLTLILVIFLPLFLGNLLLNFLLKDRNGSILIEVIYSKTSWILGFSLIFVHLNYWIKEFRKLRLKPEKSI